MSHNDNLQPPVYLPGVRQQPNQTSTANAGRHSQRQQQYPAPPMDRNIDPGALQAMLMQRLMMAGGNGAGTSAEPVTLHHGNPTGKSTSLFPGYTVYRCVDEDNKLMRAVGKTDQLGNTDQFIISEQVVQAMILDENLTVVDLGGGGGGAGRIKVVPIKTPPMSSLGLIYVEEAAVNRSSGRSLSGPPRRAGNLLID